MGFKDLPKGRKSWEKAVKSAFHRLTDTQEIKKHAKKRVLTKNIHFGKSFRKTAKVGFIAGLVAPYANDIVESNGFICSILGDAQIPETAHVPIVTGLLTGLVAYLLELVKHQLKIKIPGIL